MVHCIAVVGGQAQCFLLRVAVTVATAVKWVVTKQHRVLYRYALLCWKQAPAARELFEGR